jgi:hypothetical protein
MASNSSSRAAACRCLAVTHLERSCYAAWHVHICSSDLQFRPAPNQHQASLAAHSTNGCKFLCWCLRAAGSTCFSCASCSTSSAPHSISHACMLTANHCHFAARHAVVSPHAFQNKLDNLRMYHHSLLLSLWSTLLLLLWSTLLADSS